MPRTVNQLPRQDIPPSPVWITGIDVPFDDVFVLALKFFVATLVLWLIAGVIVGVLYWAYTG